jgi:y4mF family transcriptional regulator
VIPFGNIFGIRVDPDREHSCIVAAALLHKYPNGNITMPKRSPFDDLSTMASAAAAAKSARDLISGGLDDATLRAVRESQTLQSALVAAKGGTATSRLLEADAGLAKAMEMSGALGTVIPKDSVAEAIGHLHAGSALDTSKLFPKPVIRDVVGKTLKEMQAASGLVSVVDSFARGGLGPNYRQLAGPDVVSALDYASPMRGVFDELGGAIAPMRSPASAPKALPAPRPHPVRAAPEGQGASPPATAAMASAPVTIGDIGKRVRAARKAMGMTQQRFADLAGVGRRFLIELEQGKPSLEVGRVLAVCHAAGIKLGFLT